MFALTDGRIILPHALVTGKALLIEGSRIRGVVDHIPAGYEPISVGGRYIAPGLIDIHIHGALGRSFNHATREAWSTITRENAARGITALLPTISTDSLDQMIACLGMAHQRMQSPQEGAHILGVHVEGPFFAPEFAGAQNPRHLRWPDAASVDRLLAFSDILRIMSFAPELPGALELTERLTRLGIIAAAGHSGATDADLRAAVDRGLSHAIHLWSGQSTTRRVGPWRVPGLLEAVLASDHLTAEMICDNRHLPATLMKLAVRCLGVDRLCAISDATNGAGLPEGTRFNFAGLDCEVRDGVAMLPDHTAFAGSTTLLNQMIPILTDVIGLPLYEAVRMASLTPARTIGVDGRKGSLEVGKDADIAIFSDDFSAWGTLISGEWVYFADQV